MLLEITYNPYTVVSNIKIDGVVISADDDLVYPIQNRRLQDWIDSFLKNVYEARRDSDFRVIFHGMSLDGEDVHAALRQLRADMLNQNISIDISNFEVDAREPDSKRTLALQKLFEKGENSPYDDFSQLFKSGKMKEAFDNAMNTIFEANVVATMSAGKSTFINSMLGQQLLPSANTATTATIARIINRDGMNDFRCQRYDKNGNPIGEPNELATREKMKNWNADDETSFMDIEGDIPTINEADNMTIAFIDTPGPNNSNNEEHYRTTMEAISNKTLSMVIYVLNARQLGINDDAKLLDAVRDAMAKGGRQAQDRFVFVANQFDAFDPDEEDIGEALTNVRKYLNNHGIKNPLVIPISAKLALLLRKKKYFGASSLSEKQSKELNTLIANFLDIPEFNMVKYVYDALSPRSKNTIQKMLENANTSKDDAQKAEILSGVPVVEILLNNFLQKHAVPAKLKDAVDSFKSLLQLGDELQNMTDVLEQTQKEFEESVAVFNQHMNSKERLEKVQDFRTKIQSMTYDVSAVAEQEGQKILGKMEATIREVKEKLTSTSKITPSVAQVMVNNAQLRCNQFAIEVQMVLNEALDREYRGELSKLRRDYEEYAASILNKSFPADSPIRKMAEKAMGLPPVDALLQENTQKETKRVKDGGYWRSNRKWYNPFSWFKSDTWVDTYKTVTEEYVSTEPIANDFASKVRQYPQTILAEFKEKAKQNVDAAKQQLLEHLKEIDERLDKVQQDLAVAQSNQSQKSKVVEENRKKLEWFKQFNQELEHILAI